MLLKVQKIGFEGERINCFSVDQENNGLRKAKENTLLAGST